MRDSYFETCKKTWGMGLIFIVLLIGLITSSGCIGTTGVYEHTRANPPEAPQIGMDSGDIMLDLNLLPESKMRKYTVTVFPSGTGERVEIDSVRHTGKLYYRSNNCSFSFDNEGMTGLTCEIEKHSNSSYENLAAESFESGVFQCFCNMKDEAVTYGRLGSEDERVICIIQKEAPCFTCIKGGFYVDMHVGGAADDFIDGCRMGAVASNMAYNTNMNLEEYVLVVPTGFFY
jgi:hypothetical protein